MEEDILDVTVPVHGVLAPEGVRTRDGRLFDAEAIWWNQLPMPLLWQERTEEGHGRSVVVGRIDTVERRADQMLHFGGAMLATEHAAKVVDLIAQGAQRSLSVDLFDAETEYRAQDGTVITRENAADYAEESENFTFAITRGELGGATIVAFGAFREAYIALGPLGAEVVDITEAQETEEELEAMVASAATDLVEGLESELAEAVVAAATGGQEFLLGRTEDGPGWLTHPIPTDRLRDYWVRGPGAAKIAWGTPGDFNRCRRLLAPYVKPMYLSGYCANRHHDALGTWPGRHSGEPLTTDETPEAYTLVASGRTDAPPAAWFENPRLVGPSPLTVTEDGRVFGHVATWETCHIAYKDRCVQPPRSASDYAYFCTGSVLTAEGTTRRCGLLTIDTGHPGLELGYAAAAAHYDNTGTGAAWVEAGEDQYGIWVAGAVTPWATAEQIAKLRSAKLSGDWRPVRGASEMVAALAVNVGGFPIPRARETAYGVQALVAAGVVPRGEEFTGQSLDSELARVVGEELDRREAERATRERMSSLRTKVATERLAKIKSKRGGA